MGLLTVGGVLFFGRRRPSLECGWRTFWKQNHELNVQSFVPSSCKAVSFFLTTSCLCVPPSDSDGFSGDTKQVHPTLLP